MNFDRLAKSYRLLECLVFGRALQRARSALLPMVKAREGRRMTVGVLGGGDGRLLELLAESLPRARFLITESSEAMRRETRRRVASGQGVDYQFVEELPEEGVELLVAAFFFDCFDLAGARPILRRELAGRDLAEVLLVEFAPDCRPRCFFAFLEFVMIAFFRLVCGVSTRRLHDWEGEMRAAGWQCVASRSFYRGFVVSGLWKKARTSA